jgi:hypothetical protein
LRPPSIPYSGQYSVQTPVRIISCRCLGHATFKKYKRTSRSELSLWCVRCLRLLACADNVIQTSRSRSLVRCHRTSANLAPPLERTHGFRCYLIPLWLCQQPSLRLCRYVHLPQGQAASWNDSRTSLAVSKVLCLIYIKIPITTVGQPMRAEVARDYRRISAIPPGHNFLVDHFTCACVIVSSRCT